MIKLLQPLSDLIFPPLCLHCDCVRKNGEKLFCVPCSQSMEMLDPASRCRYCFSNDTGKGMVCKNCRGYSPLFQKVASVFDYSGPPATLIKKLKYGSKPYLAEGAAAFMTAQFMKLGWPLPDLVTSTPMAWLKELNRGYNQSKLMAQFFAEFINVPYKDILERNSSGYSQAGLNNIQRKCMKTNPYNLKNSVDISDLRILLIDDVLTTGTTLRKCGLALEEGCPMTLYTLTFCRA